MCGSESGCQASGAMPRLHNVVVVLKRSCSRARARLRGRPGGAEPDEQDRYRVVGDPKQSIYRFRRADITMYLHAQSILGERVDRSCGARTQGQGRRPACPQGRTTEPAPSSGRSPRAGRPRTKFWRPRRAATRRRHGVLCALATSPSLSRREPRCRSLSLRSTVQASCIAPSRARWSTTRPRCVTCSRRREPSPTRV